MKLVFAPDSFKGSLSALEGARLLDRAARACFGNDVETLLIPMADGGEGTAEALCTALGGEMRLCTVTGPLGEPVQANWAMLPDGTAVVETAQAAGLPQVPVEKRNPLFTTTRGVGEVMLRALDEGAKALLIGLGGSATNDGGCGMLRALGARLTGEDGAQIPEGGVGLEKIARIDLSGLDRRLAAVPIRAMCDVTNPLLGKTGATFVYGPQKGADEGILARLERGMTRYAKVAQDTLGRDIQSFPGAGAAGGLGAALHGLLDAQLVKGIDALMEVTRLSERLENADLCVTGEGCFDEQSVAFGKVVSGVAKACVRQRVPLLVLAGSIRGGAQALYDLCPHSSLLSIVPGVVTLEQAMHRAPEYFFDAAVRAFRLWGAGRG